MCTFLVIGKSIYVAFTMFTTKSKNHTRNLQQKHEWLHKPFSGFLPLPQKCDSKVSKVEVHISCRIQSKTYFLSSVCSYRKRTVFLALHWKKNILNFAFLANVPFVLFYRLIVSSLRFNGFHLSFQWFLPQFRFNGFYLVCFQWFRSFLALICDSQN